MRERKRERVPRQPYKIKQNFSEKIFLLKSSVGKKEREREKTQFALSALGPGGVNGEREEVLVRCNLAW